MKLKICTYLLSIFCTVTSNFLAMEQPPKKVVLSPEKQLAETKGIAWYLLSRYGADSDNSEGILPPLVIDNIINHEKQAIIDQIKKLSDYIPTPCTHTLQGHTNWIKSVAYNPDGTQLASGSTDTTIKLWDPKNGKCIHTLEGHSSSVNSVAYNPDGTQLASGSTDTTIKRWNPKNGKCIHTLEGHSDSVPSVVYNHNGTQFASGSWNNTVKIWDPKNSKCIHTLEGHSYSVISVAYNHDGTQLASGSEDTTIKLWDLTTFNKIYNSLDSLTLEQATSLLQHLQTIKNNGLE